MTDRRVREAVVTAKGKAMTDRVDAARERMGGIIFESWDAHDIDEHAQVRRRCEGALVRENRRYDAHPESQPARTSSVRELPSTRPVSFTAAPTTATPGSTLTKPPRPEPPVASTVDDGRSPMK